MKAIQVGLIGFGTVGSGVVKVLRQNADVIEKRVGRPVVLARIADLDVTTDRGVQVPAGTLTTKVGDILDDPAIDIVVELIGGHEPAKRFILQAIERKKSVVTANKALLADHGEEIFEAAFKSTVDVGFEASVGGGIPIIRSLTEGLAGNRVASIMGIMNGTSNYILTRMTNEHRDFAEILQEAKREGYAEADPSLDVDGIDAAHKLAIMVNLAYGTPVRMAEIFTEGISGLSTVDMEFAKELGLTIKLLGIAKLRDQSIEARVHPTLVPAGSPIAQVGGVYNAIHLIGDAVGDVVLYGKGAGSLPTASAVVGDIIDLARNRISGVACRVPPTSFQWEHRQLIPIRPMATIESMYYLRCMVKDQPNVLSKISGILGGHGISISSVLQKGRKAGQTVPLVILTHRSLEAAIQTALREINALPLVSEPTTLLRMEELE
ncbi:MAG: homoserine dehydrogenase [Nitrospira sp.]|nr:homoserine dehydrogenase [Nitrospira sp.]MCA9476410.1 homoserine dehydrogenase [Nitrospira sp.]MCB9710838.1 homoserine dehydrogenase [Nitrospiraceae bacterium]MDR4488711.1 homoserine dehydrogenase [Nitrospirales bacterium]